MALASLSVSLYSSNPGCLIHVIVLMHFSMITGISEKLIFPSRKACTAISLAAFRVQGMLPPAYMASKASARLRNFFKSGARKLSMG